jgi:internalin A
VLEQITESMEELAKKLADRDYMVAELLERIGAGGKAERIEGMELRALRKLLDEVDTKQEWGGLKKVLTPEGHYLWLCKEHAEEYKK